jgi:hypothetical protein
MRRGGISSLGETECDRTPTPTVPHFHVEERISERRRERSQEGRDVVHRPATQNGKAVRLEGLRKTSPRKAGDVLVPMHPRRATEGVDQAFEQRPVAPLVRSG